MELALVEQVRVIVRVRLKVPLRPPLDYFFLTAAGLSVVRGSLVALAAATAAPRRRAPQLILSGAWVHIAVSDSF
ncbi:hypothetical protein [Micromonospora sp. LA-10]|uniref:hypothetical protein n=1 Tax=Micromonospora sp. LA-10 TaxID=3446364 RepID=UPI003F703ED6